MKTWEQVLDDYLAKLHNHTSEYNTNLIREYTQQYKALPENPSARRLFKVVTILSSICKMLNQKPLDKLTENDLKDLNLTMREKKFKSSQDYRKGLKKFLKITNKKKYIDLIDSDFMRAPRKKATETPLVDVDEFFSQSEIDSYIEESRKTSPRQLAWAGLWLSTGCRPHELLNLTKNQIEYHENLLRVRVNSTKTGKRTIILENSEAQGVWHCIQPHIEKLSDDEKLFKITWTGQSKLHHEICKRINLPKTKSRKLYIARKMVLTKFYNTYGLVKAAHMAGHTPGSPIMRHYVALSENELTGQQPTRVEFKICPNLKCSTLNEPNLSHCKKCKAPLDKQTFNDLITQNIDEKINAQIELIKKDFLIKILTIQNNQTKQTTKEPA